MVNDDVIVRFAGGFALDGRAELMIRLREVGATARQGFDLDHRGPDDGEVAVTVAQVTTTSTDPAELTAYATAMRDWLRSSPFPGTVRVDLEHRATGATARITAADPDEALAGVPSMVAAWSGTRPRVWDGADWAEVVPVDVGAPVHVLAVADEWFPRRGGISAFNRYLCTALVAARAMVTCVLPSATAEERRDAKERGVRLVEAPRLPGGTDRERLSRKPVLPGGVEPDVVIGHGRITGAPALVLADGYESKPARLHFVHMQPDQIEWHKLDRSDDAATRAADRTREEAELGAGATRILAVGPGLHRYAVRDLTDNPATPRPLRIDPGFDGVPAGGGAPKEGVPLVLVLGRMEDAEVKGLVLAAKALGHAVAQLGLREDAVDLLVRGAPKSQGDLVRTSVLEWAGIPGLRVSIRNYTSDPGDVLSDVRRSSLVLMPSLEEGFGLVGMEAIAAGIPVLVSGRSGLGLLLEEVLAPELARRVVVPVRKDVGDPQRWGSEINAVLRDLDAAFATARTVRDVMVRERPWSRAAREVLAAAGAVRRAST